MTADWHLDAGELDGYGRGVLHGPSLWSVEAHLAACPACRDGLAATAAVPAVDRVWQRIDAVLDAPRPGPLEWVLLRTGVPEHLARLLAATPALRLSWLGAVAGMLGLSVAASWVSRSTQTPVPLLAVAPLVAVAGIAAAFGPRVDPTYEIGLVAPFHTFRLVLLRATAVLSVTVVLAGIATVAVPDTGLRAAAWLVPALLLTVASLALSPALGPVRAAGSAAATWLVALAATVRLPAGTSVLFEPAAQLGMGVAALLAAAAVAVTRRRFETHRSFDPHPTFRRLLR
jgi:hypothetical protein